MLKLLVTFSLMAAACASGIIAPIAYPYTTPYFGYPAYSENYRGPLSLAPGQPASILGADGRPLDTLDVNLDKSAHYTAKALAGSGIHLLKKRSAAVIAPSSTLPYTYPGYSYAGYNGYNSYPGYGYNSYPGYGYNSYPGYGYNSYPGYGYGYSTPLGYHK